VLHRLVLVRNLAGALALGLLALELSDLELLGDGILGHMQNVARAAVQPPNQTACDDQPVGERATPADGGVPDPISVVGIDHVQVAAPAGSEEEARSFYGRLLGLPELPKPPVLRARGGVWFACGAHQLHVGIDEPFSPAVKAHPALAIRPADLARLAERLSQAGCPVQWDDALPGTRRFYTSDPWGNRLELVAAD
jgi:catechol 2,3-dioxygenase-like lactoylglutathione lyase family enzyme